MNHKIVLAVLALAAPLVEQQPGKPDSMRAHRMGAGPMGAMGGMGGMGMMSDNPMMQAMGAAMMKVMPYTPQHLLARKEALALTPDQVTRLTALRDAAMKARDAAQAEAMTHVSELGQAADAAQPDTAALKTHFQAAHAAMGKAHWAMLAAAAQARAMLTDAQRGQQQVWADSMQAWGRQHQQMMKPDRSH